MAAAALAADVTAHRAVILAAQEMQEAVRSLATLSANVDEAIDNTVQFYK